MKQPEKKGMEKVFEYIITHPKEQVTEEDMISLCGYHPRYFRKKFKEVYEMSFREFVTKYRMHSAARQIQKTRRVRGVWKEYGYSTSMNFSRAFRKEMGMSPEEFCKWGWYIKDFPERTTIENVPYELRYEFVDQKKEEMTYVYWSQGEICMEPKGMAEVAPANYAVFTILVSDEDSSRREQVLTGLVSYVFQQWRWVNFKEIDFSIPLFYVNRSRQTEFYIPLIQGMENFPGGEKTEVYRSNSWARYLDLQMTRQIDLDEVAEHFYYSRRQFERLFYMLYEDYPLDYIKKRRFYLAAAQIRKEPDKIESICRRYHLESAPDFWSRSEQLFAKKEFTEEDMAKEEKEEKEQYQAIDLLEYYEEYKKYLTMTLEEREEKLIYGSMITKLETSEYENNLPALMAQQLSDVKKGDIWYSLWVEHQGEQEETEYLFGQEASASSLIGKDDLCECAKIAGGLYAVFEPTKIWNNEKGNTFQKTFQMMERCVYYGWLNKNRYMWDGSRNIFNSYEDGNMKCHVPIYQ